MPKSPTLIADTPVLFVMAAEAEYGPALRARIAAADAEARRASAVLREYVEKLQL